MSPLARPVTGSLRYTQVSSKIRLTFFPNFSMSRQNFPKLKTSIWPFKRLQIHCQRDLDFGIKNKKVGIFAIRRPSWLPTKPCLEPRDGLAVEMDTDPESASNFELGAHDEPGVGAKVREWGPKIFKKTLWTFSDFSSLFPRPFGKRMHHWQTVSLASPPSRECSFNISTSPWALWQDPWLAVLGTLKCQVKFGSLFSQISPCPGKIFQNLKHQSDRLNDSDSLPKRFGLWHQK